MNIWGQTVKERWAFCEQLGQILDERKEHLFTCLTEIRDNNLLIPILAGEADAIQAAKDIIHAKFHSNFNTTTTVRTTTTVETTPPNRPLTDFEIALNDHKIMLWAVNKIGDPMRALAAFEGIFKALK